jgi:hypothetical protein
MEKVKPTICYHPELRPTDWNQPKPEPCEMILTCECGENQTCPVCGYGHGNYPCTCMREHKKENPVQIILNDNDKVTHGIFFGENIKRIKILINKK